MLNLTSNAHILHVTVNGSTFLLTTEAECDAFCAARATLLALAA